MKAFSFVHAADLHLGYSQYGLEARREDFDKAFHELIDKTIELEPAFIIIAGDIFHQPRPSNITLENAIGGFARLREAGIPVLTVDGSHDSAPNSITGTILNPLDSAGLVWHLPRHKGACWMMPDSCYVYGIPNCRTRQRTEDLLPRFIEENAPSPDSMLFNIFVFHLALDLPDVTPPYIEAEARVELMPEGFDYYAAGHVHKPHKQNIKTGLLVYSGCTETTDYLEADVQKGFFHVRVDERKNIDARFIRLESNRKFRVLEQDFSGSTPSKITELAANLVKSVDEDGLVIVPVVKGTLPAEASRAEVDIARIRSAAEKALLVHPVLQLRESAVSEETVRSIFESNVTDLRTKSFEYFQSIFSERFGDAESEKMAHAAVDLLEPLVEKDEGRVKKALEGLLN